MSKNDVNNASLVPSPLVRNEDEELLTGWGRTAPSMAFVREPHSIEDVQTAIVHAGARGVLARGLGRSYGDAAQSGGATVLRMPSMNTFTLDPVAATVTADAGASLEEILTGIVPLGFFVPVTPGTRMVTVGGAIAADIHGKNHHVDGSFGSHVTSLTLIDGTGAIRTLSPTDLLNSNEFWATVGGMGLTGVIVEATFNVIPIDTALMSVDTERGANLDELMGKMIDADARYRYSVAWIDSVSTAGRGVITSGEHATLDQLTAAKRSTALVYDPKVVATAPKFIPGGLINKLSMRAFNETWFRKHPKSRAGDIHSIAAFFHPLDGVQEWNRVYGPAGFLQYQFVVPDTAGHVIGEALARLRAVGAPSFLTVLKRFGSANPAPLSFPEKGWTLAMDIPTGVAGLATTLDGLDELVADSGGRLYLAKDSRQSPEMFRRTYPRLAQWQEVRSSMDPHGVFTSDLARRLQL
jgi:decaprenylphospho-beta-D-ribofuranose 2-oxidase